MTTKKNHHVNIDFKCVYHFPIGISDLIEAFIQPFSIKIVDSINHLLSIENHFHLSSLLFTEISKTYKPFYYQNIGKNIEEDLKKIKVSNVLNISKCQFPNIAVPHPQLWPDSATLSSSLTNLISFCDKLDGAVNEGRAVYGI